MDADHPPRRHSTSQLTRSGKPWSRTYKRCRGCQTRTRPHRGNGYCARCYDQRCRPERWRRRKRLLRRERYWRERVELLEKRARSDAITRTTARALRRAEKALDYFVRKLSEPGAEYL